MSWNFHICKELLLLFIIDFSLWKAAKLNQAKETTQVGPVLMDVCDMANILILMIIGITRRVDNTTKTTAYADDLTAAGKIIPLKHWWETLFKIGPKFGYHLQKQPPEVFCKKGVLQASDLQLY